MNESKKIKKVMESATLTTSIVEDSNDNVLKSLDEVVGRIKKTVSSFELGGTRVPREYYVVLREVKSQLLKGEDLLKQIGF
jgi:hypothetical protein